MKTKVVGWVITTMAAIFLSLLVWNFSTVQALTNRVTVIEAQQPMIQRDLQHLNEQLDRVNEKLDRFWGEWRKDKQQRN